MATISKISTGAPNVYLSMHTAAALDGSTLPGGITIKAKPLMGIESNGMLCSGEELGLNEDLYPGAEVYGLLDLPKDTVPGTPIQQVVGLDDYIFDISITANRADCQSVLGIAREVAAVLNKPPPQNACHRLHGQRLCGPPPLHQCGGRRPLPALHRPLCAQHHPWRVPALDAPSAGPVRPAQHLQRR